MPDLKEDSNEWLAASRLAAIVDSCDDAIISKDLDGYITSWNKGAERIFGYAAKEAIGKHITIIIPTERHKEEPAILERLRKGERVDHYETVRVAKDGRQISISLTISPIRDEKGHIVGASKIARDITQQKSSEAAVQQAQAQLREYAVTLEDRVAERTKRLEEVVKSLEGLSYSIAHDLRAPLRAIEGMTEILLEDHPKQFDESGQRVAQEIIKSVRRMDNLITDLMNYGRLSHGELPSVSVHVDEVVRQVARNLRAEIEAANASIEIAAGLPVVKAHWTTLEQVVTNLVGNAVKFIDPTKPAKVRIYATDTAGPGNDFARVVVEDNGIGFSPEFRDRIYLIFERLHAGNKYPGTGIGLAIVQKGIERMGGRTGVESESGKGSKFWFELPRG